MRNRRWNWAAIAIAPLLCAAAEDALRTSPPPQPPPAEHPVGTVMFADNFSSGLSAWRPDRAGVWSIRHGALLANLPDQRQLRSLIWAGDSTWTDYALDFDVCMLRGVDKGAVVRALGETGVGIDLRGDSYQDVVAYVREWPLGRAGAVNMDNAWNHVRVEVEGESLRVYVNHELRLAREQAKVRRGRIALAAYTGGVGKCTVYYDNVLVTRPK